MRVVIPVKKKLLQIPHENADRHKREISSLLEIKTDLETREKLRRVSEESDELRGLVNTEESGWSQERVTGVRGEWQVSKERMDFEDNSRL